MRIELTVSSRLETEAATKQSLKQGLSRNPATLPPYPTWIMTRQYLSLQTSIPFQTNSERMDGSLIIKQKYNNRISNHHCLGSIMYPLLRNVMACDPLSCAVCVIPRFRWVVFCPFHNTVAEQLMMGSIETPMDEARHFLRT